MFCFILEVDECLVHVILRNTQLKVVKKWQDIINNLAVVILHEYLIPLKLVDGFCKFKLGLFHF